VREIEAERRHDAGNTGVSVQKVDMLPAAVEQTPLSLPDKLKSLPPTSREG